MSRRFDAALFAGAVALGIACFAVGFRLTSEVTIVLAALLLAGGVIACARGQKPWLWGLGLGLGTRISDLMPAASILHEPRLSAAHVAKEGASRPLPLPFGLTGNRAAEWLVMSLIIMAFPLLGAMLGWTLRKVMSLAARAY